MIQGTLIAKDVLEGIAQILLFFWGETMVRTVNEEKCVSCGRITNNYDACLGRFCPSCAKDLATEIIKNRCALLEKPSEPLIDHSNDIDIRLQPKDRKEQKQKLQQIIDKIQFGYDRMPIPSEAGPIVRQILDELKKFERNFT